MNLVKKLSLFVLLLCSAGAIAQNKTPKDRTLIVIFDGLRPDYITPETMPNLYALSKAGSYARDNHSVFPTVTRVNASSYATGSYPSTHGLMGNSVFFPKVHKTKVWNTGEAAEMQEVAEATLGNLLTSVSFGEVLQKQGERFMIFSSGSTGQAYLQNHKLAGGAIINPALILPNAWMPEVVKVLGSPPPYAKPNTARHEWITNGFLHYGLAADGPLVSAIWFSDPDGTAHAEGIGSPLAMESIQIVDREFGRILKGIEDKGLKEHFNIVVSTDHGFVTHAGTSNLTDFLISHQLKKDRESDDVILAGGAIYVKDHNIDVIQKIVTLLQEQEWIGAIFTKSVKPGDTKGFISGTLSFESIHWNHDERAADILVDYNWDNRKNKHGYEGTSFSRGIAGHGGSSPFEIHIPLIMAGPAFKTNFESFLPASNIDIVPTLLMIHKIAIPASMEGRVLNEMLVKPAGETNEKVWKETIETTAQGPWGTYVLKLERSILGKYQYVNWTAVERIFKDIK